MVSSRTATLVLVTSLLTAVAAPAGAVLPVRADLEIRRPVLAPEVARAGTPSSPRRALGLGVKVFEKTAFEKSAVDAISRRLLTTHVLGGVAASELRPIAIRNFDDGMSYADYTQTYQGLEVVDSHIGLRFRDGKHVLTTAVTFPGITISTTPVVDGARAESVAVAALAGAGVEGLALAGRSELVVYPQDDTRFRLAFRNYVRSASPAGNWMTIVAADGSDEILARHNGVAYAVGQFQVQVEPRYIGQPTVSRSAPGHAAGGKVTDGDGIWETAAGNVTVPNAGSFFSITNDAAAAKTKQINVAGSGFEQFTWMSTEAPLEEIDPFYYANQTHELQLQVAPDIAWYYQVLSIKTNVSGTCNAFYDGSSLNFFPTGGGCNSTSRIADVIYHEYGHGIHDHLTPGGLGGSAAVAEIQEGVADIFAHELTNDPNLGPNFFPGQMAGIRNAEDVRTYPSGVQGANAEVHESGKVWTNTWWLLRKAMLAKLGPAIGSYDFNLLHANTLRGGAVYTTAYSEAIAADDDDADPSNGTPNSCEINQIFQSHGLLMGTAAATRGYLALSHTQPAGAFQPADAAVNVSVNVDSKSPSCGGLDPASVTLHYKVNGAAEQTVALSGTAPAFSGAIPAQATGSLVEYWFTAKENAKQAEFSAPLRAPSNVFTMHVGALTEVFTDDFESDKSWTHGGDIASHDDWERGTPAGNYFDPASAHSGTSVFGNDIGVRGGNGLYESGTSNFLESPTINCSACQGARLQFWRSLDVAAGDVATVKVNGTTVWTSEAAGRNDLGWAFADLDIATLADGKNDLKIRFELTSDAKSQRSGWTIDDVSVMAEQGGTTPGNPPPGAAGIGESLNGGCKCNVAAGQSPNAGTAAVVALGAFAMMIARRKRSA